MRAELLALALGAIAMMPACGGRSSGGDASEPGAGQWYAGDFHVHTSVASNDTRYPDGSVRSFPEVIGDTARARGMSFVVLTDHSNSAGSRVDTTVEDAQLWNRGPEFPLWDRAAELSSADFLMIDGSELSPVSTLAPEQCENCPTVGTGQLTPVGHVGCIPGHLSDFDRSGAFVDRPPGQVLGGSGIAQCHARGGFAIVNHPFYRVTPWIDYDWTSFDYDALEVWNGSAGFASFDSFAYDAYLCDRLEGRSVVAVGGSDNHRTPLPYEDEVTLALGAPLGLPMTSVFAERLEWDAIMAGVRRGRVVIHERGTFVEFRAFAADGAELGWVGDTISGPHPDALVRLHARSPRTQQLRVVRVAPGACEDRRTAGRDVFPVVQHTVVFSEEICSAGPCELTRDVPIALQPGLYYASVGELTILSLNIRDVALTNVLSVRAAEPG